MSAKVYTKSAKNAEHALRATGENRLDITDADENILRKALDAQCDQYEIKGLKLKLIQVVFRQTIGYGKREDDLSGVCLQGLVGSRRDYCNKHTTELINQSILLSRKGFYGRILSINYNFDDWGKAPEDIETQHSEPEKLLQNKQKENTSSAHVPCENPVSDAPALHNQDTELSVDALSAALANTIPANLAMLITEDLIKQGLQKLIEIVTSLLKDTPIFNFISTLIPPQIQAEVLPENTNLSENHSASPETEKAPHNQTETEKAPHNQTEIETEAVETPKIPENPAEIAVIPSPEIPEQPTKPEEKPTTVAAITNPESAATHTQDYDQLVFPVELKPYEQNQITRILEKEAVSDLDTVQAVLDSMGSRFKIAMEPIKSPIAYFRHLLNSTKTDDFDRSYAEIYHQQCQEKAQQKSQATEKQKSREAINKYNEAKNNYDKLKLYLEHTDKSMRELAKDLGWLDLLEEMGFDLGAEIPA